MNQEDQLPMYEIPLRKEGGDTLIFDLIRKKELTFTREEYVRQCLVKFLHEEKSVPLGLMSVERKIKINSLTKRYDLVVFGRDGIPILCAECKAPEIEIDESTSRQLGIYNLEIKAKYFLLTNGPVLKVFFRNENGKFVKVNSLPSFDAW